MGKVFTSKCVGTGPSSYEKRIYQVAVSKMLRNTGIYDARPIIIPLCYNCLQYSVQKHAVQVCSLGTKGYIM